MQNTLSLPSFIKIVALALLAAGQPCFAISMLHTTNWNATDNTNPYIVEGAKYNSVGFVQWTSTAAGNASYVGTGTLVPSSVAGQFKFLTAAHNVDSEGPGNKADGVIDALTFTIYFGANTSADGSTRTGALTVPAANIAVHPFWQPGDGAGLNTGASQYDLAVMTFTTANVTGVLPSALNLSYNAPTAGQTGTMVGYGSWGNGQAFAGTASDGIRRAGQNSVDVIGLSVDSPANTGSSLQTDFDGPLGEGHTIGTNVPLALESSTAGGDSGGPLIVGDLVVGVLNGGFPGTAGGKLSEYGDRSIWAPLFTASNQTFLTNAGVAVPEPAGALLPLLALGIFGLRRRRAASPQHP